MNKSVVVLLFFALMPNIIRAAPAPTVVVSVVRENVSGQTISVNGVVQSRSDLLLSPTIEGELLWVLEPGSIVAAHSAVAKVDDRFLRLEKNEQKLLADRALINIRYLNGEVDRLSRLQETNLGSRTQLADMVSRRDLAKNQHSVVRSRIAQLDERLSRTDLVSPVSGVVVQRMKQGGEFARRGGAVVRIVDPDSLEVRISVPIAHLGRMRQETILEVRRNNEVINGRLRTIVYAGNESSQTFEAIVDLPDSEGHLVLDGEFAMVNIPLDAQDESLFVPRDAVVLRSDGHYVYRIDQHNRVNRIMVVLGEGLGELVAVSGELKAGDRVAIRGVEKLNDGQAVSPTC